MPLNPEERHAHEKYKREQHVKPTIDQLEIAKLEEELNATRNLVSRLEFHLDKQTKKLDQVNGHLKKFIDGDRLEGVTLDNIILAMGWKL